MTDERHKRLGGYSGPAAMFGQRIERRRNWVRENRGALPVLLLCIVLIIAGLVGITYVLAGAQTASFVLILFLVVVPIGLAVLEFGDFAFAAVYRGFPTWPRFSSFIRRVVFAGVYGSMAALMARGMVDQWSYAPVRSVGAGVVIAGLIYLAILAALDRLPGRGKSA